MGSGDADLEGPPCSSLYHPTGTVTVDEHGDV